MKTHMKEKELFEESTVLRAVISLAFPSVMGQIILVIYNMADTFFVGLTGKDVMITSVTICMPAFMFLSAISNLFGVGGASVISRSLGQQCKEKARHASGFAFWGCLSVTAVYSLGTFLLMSFFVNLLGGIDPAVHQNASAYMMVTVVLGGMITSANMLLAHLIRAEGSSLQASIGIAVGGVLNIALDPLFMFVLLPAGREALGAGIATTLSNLCALLYYILILVRNRKKLVLSMRPDKKMFADNVPCDVMSSGLPACLMTLCENISYAVLGSLMSAAGTATQAGIGVAKKVNMLAHCIVRGMAHGVLPLIGYNYASRNRKRMCQTVYISAAASVVISGLCMVVCLIFSGELIGIFISRESASHNYGAVFLQIMCIGAPFSACAYTVISFFQATGQGGKSLILALLRKGILDIPMMFAFSRLYPVYGIVWATPIADVLCCVMAVTLLTRFLVHTLAIVE